MNIANCPICGSGTYFEEPEPTGFSIPTLWSSRVRCDDCDFSVDVRNGRGEFPQLPEKAIVEWNRIAAYPQSHKRLANALWKRETKGE